MAGFLRKETVFYLVFSFILLLSVCLWLPSEAVCRVYVPGGRSGVEVFFLGNESLALWFSI